MFDLTKGIYFQSDSGNGSGPAPAPEGEETMSFETWIIKQDEKVKGMLDSHTKGLKTALDTERGNRKELEKQVRELAGKAEKGSDAEKQLTQLADKLTESDRRADFFDAAHKAGVTNLKLAYTVAATDDLFDKKGNADFGKLKEAYPELFGVKKAPAGNAGEGTEGRNELAADMNSRIRRLAGRTTN